MGLIFREDPVFGMIHEALQANVLSVPDGRIRPLSVIERPRTGSAKYRTTLAHVVREASDVSLNETYLETEPMANISGEHTQDMNIDLGLEMLAGYLRGFGVTLPNLKLHFRGIQRVSFSFENVQRVWADNGLLAQELRDKHIERNAVTEGFFGLLPTKLLLVDSIITSNDFSIHATETTDDGFTFNPTPIAETLEGTGSDLGVYVRNQRTLTFRGNAELPFAFTCVQLRLDKAGKIVEMPPFVKKVRRLMRSDRAEEWEKEQWEDGFIELQ